MKVVYAVGIEGARAAAGAVVVIDVLRAFSVSAFALAGGARECVLVATVEEARSLAASIPRAVISAEVDSLPIPGIDISNSPTQITQTQLTDRTLVQRTSAGTPVINAVGEGHALYAGSLLVARATAHACLSTGEEVLTLVASADFPEDHACARYIASIIEGRSLDLADLLEPLYRSPRYRRLAGGGWPGFPASDLELALVADRFDFAMPATKRGGHVALTAAR
jgi:2-phosphosulfolactate phosphatase